MTTDETVESRFPSDRQSMQLLDHASNDREIRTGQFVAPHGKQKIPKKWERIALDLNALDGAKKDSTQWMAVSTLLDTPRSSLQFLQVIL